MSSSAPSDHSASRRSPPTVVGILLVGLFLGLTLRATGFSRGSAGQESNSQPSNFYLFHPDERTLIESALSLSNPADPPLTAYGLLPIYIAIPPLEVASLASGGELDMGRPDDRRIAVQCLRFVAVLFSLATLFAIWFLGRRHFTPLVGALAVLLTATVPLAVQQAHFYTVDGVYTFVAVCVALLAMHVAAQGRAMTYATGGVMVGMAAAVRLNGLLLGLVLLAGHLAHCRRKSERSGLGWLADGLRHRRIWLAAVAAGATLVALQPYLLVSPELLWRAESTDDLAYSAQVATGDILRPWTLFYTDTAPYLYYWTDLWPLAVGWPLTIVFVMAVIFAIWQRRERHVILLLFVGLDFMTVGGLYTKHVRYLLPSLPMLCLLAADMCQHVLRAGGNRRRLAQVGATLICLHTGFYGIAFARIYSVPDSRIQAGTWIERNLPPDSPIGLEGGGFSVSAVIDDSRFEKIFLSTGRIFSTRGYLSCDAASRLLYDPLQQVVFIAVTDANRYLQYTAAPELFPATSRFYGDLVAGDLGFDVIKTFKTRPGLFGFSFREDRVEPSFVGYDHPTVLILRRRGNFEAIWSDWREKLLNGLQCADRPLAKAAALIESTPEAAKRALAQLRLEYPGVMVTFLLQARVHQLLNEPDLEQQAMADYRSGYGNPSLSGHLIPSAAASSLLALGLEELAMTALRDGADRANAFREEYHAPMAGSYVEAAAELAAAAASKSAREACDLAQHIAPNVNVLKGVAIVLYQLGDLEASTATYRKVLSLDSHDITARVNLAWNLYRKGDLHGAIAANQQILADGPNSSALFNLALAYLANGHLTQAEDHYERAVAKYGAEEGVRLGAVDDLRALVERGIQMQTTRRILKRYWPE